MRPGVQEAHADGWMTRGLWVTQGQGPGREETEARIVLGTAGSPRDSALKDMTYREWSKSGEAPFPPPRCVEQGQDDLRSKV